jgi:hypothetical protein
MKTKRSITRRAGLAGLLLAFSVTVLGAGPSAAAETYTLDRYKFSTLQTSFTYQDLATARIARVGITPIPIP